MWLTPFEKVTWAGIATNEGKQVYNGFGLESCFRSLMTDNLYTDTNETEIQTKNMDIYITDI